MPERRVASNSKSVQKQSFHVWQMKNPEKTYLETHSTHRRFIMADRKLLRLSATVLFISALVFEVASLLHPGGGANTDQAAFTVYANSSSWTAIHLGQFVGTAVFLAGLLVLFFALNVSEGTPRWLGFFGAISAGVALALAGHLVANPTADHISAISAGVALALAGVVYAVDGVALKQATDAWVSAPAAEQAARFASAEAIRWLEWGTRSYYNFMQGLALVLYALVIVWTARVPRPIGYLMGLSGLAFIVLGWLVGTEGFTSANTVPTYVGHGLNDVWMIWLLIVAWRRKESVQAAPA